MPVPPGVSGRDGATTLPQDVGTRPPALDVIGGEKSLVSPGFSYFLTRHSLGVDSALTPAPEPPGIPRRFTADRAEAPGLSHGCGTLMVMSRQLCAGRRLLRQDRGSALWIWDNRVVRVSEAHELITT